MTLALTMMEWLGTALQLGGAAIMATRWRRPHIAYIAMLAGAMIWLLLAACNGQWALATMQGGFFVLNIIGLLRWMP